MSEHEEFMTSYTIDSLHFVLQPKKISAMPVKSSPTLQPQSTNKNVNKVKDKLKT